VSHWTDADIERERRRMALHDVHPTYTLNETLGELFDLFEFEPFAARSDAREPTSALAAGSRGDS
jgi:hypothetical protein